MMPDMDMNGANVKGLSKKLEQLEIYNNESKEASGIIRTEIDKLIKNKTYEGLMQMKDSDDNITFYANKEKGRIKELIMYINNSDECTIIRILGNFTTEDIQSVISGSK